MIAAGAVLAVLLVAGAVAGAVALSGGDGSGGGTARTRGGEPTAPSTDEHGLTPDEQTAVANIAEVLERDADLDPAQAECTARELVERNGIEGLQRDGLLDVDLELVTAENGDPDPAVLADIFTVTFTCVFGSAASSPSPE